MMTANKANHSMERRIALERKEAERAALERVAVTLESRAGNPIYRAAWRAAAKVVRAMKHGHDFSQSLVARSEQTDVQNQSNGSRDGSAARDSKDAT